jgi:intraflagellar transport protein 140
MSASESEREFVFLQNSDAVDMCLKYNVTLTEALADQLVNGEKNSRLLTRLAEVAQRQGDYQLAAKKFTQAGDKVISLLFFIWLFEH